MGKKPGTSLKVKDFTFYPYLLRQSFADSEGYRGINFRITKANTKGKGTTIDLEVYDEHGIRIKAKGNDFANGKISGGHPDTILSLYNQRIIQIQSLIAEFIRNHKIVSKALLIDAIYGKTFIKENQKKRNKYITIPVRDNKGSIYDQYILSTKEVNELVEPVISKQTFINSDGKPKTIEGVFDFDTGESLVNSAEDFEDLVAEQKSAIEYGKMTAKRKREIEALSPEERYRINAFDKTNIFHLFGFVRYKKMIDPAGKEYDLINYDSFQLMNKLLSYRENGKNVEQHVSKLNENWVHGFYKFLKENGYQEGSHHKRPSHNPFIHDPNHKFVKGGKRKEYGLNTFGEQIHKQTLKYLTVLHEHNFIPDFIKKINASAFVREEKTNKKGQLSKYEDSVNFLEPNEFLKLMHVDLRDKKYYQKIEHEVSKKEKIDNQFLGRVTPAVRKKLILKETLKRTNDLTKVKDTFILGVLLGGLRVSDLLAGDKKKIELSSFSLIQFNQKKTGGMVKNLILKPAEQLLKKYDGKIPVESDVIFNRELKVLFKLLEMNRSISWTIYTMNGLQTNTEQLSSIIKSKFMRSTYYVLCGVMREPLDTVIKRTGHSDKAIALKHYYAVGTHYTEKDVVKLLEIFNR